MQTPLSSKVKGALGSLGSLVTSAQRQRTPAESPADPGSRQPYTDHYNFQLLATQKDIDTLRGCQDREAAQTARWQAYQQKGALPPKDELKKLCRKGVPPALRDWVWMEVSGATRRRQQHHSSYFAAMAQIGKHESPFASQIELDLPRTFPANEWVQSEQGQVALRRVLCAFAKHKADVGYCQGLNYIAAMLLLAMGHDDEKAFWLLASLIDDDSEGILYQDMFASNLSGTHVEMRSLWELVQAKLPRLAAHLQAIKCDISILATDWFMCLFATTLPSETVTRVWDALFNEGPKLLFRCALALLKLHEGLLLAKQDPGELLQALRTASAESYDRDQLLKVAFGQVGSLPMTTIRRYRKQSQQQVDHEMAMRETNKNLQRALREGFVMPPDEVHVLRDAELESDAREEARARGAWGHKLEVLSEKAKETVGKGKERLMHMTRAGSQGQIGGGPGTAAEPQPAA